MGTYTDGSTADLSSQVIWNSGTISVATISSTGLASTLATGMTDITASLGGITSTSDTLTVNPAALVSIAVAPVNPSVVKGLTEQFSATGTYTDGTTEGLTSQVQWASGTPSVATISSTGLATALRTGMTAITASLGSITSPADTFTVLAAATPATNLAISPDAGVSSTDGVTDTSIVTFTGTLPSSGMTVDVYDTSNNSDLGNATVSGTGFNKPLNLAEGSHILRVRDSLNGTTADAFFDVLVDRTSPSSHVVNSLGVSQSTDSFPVSVSYDDPSGMGGAPASGVSSVDLYVSVNNGPFSLYQSKSFAATASGTTMFTFSGQDRNLYAFHSVAHDAAGNTENKSGTAVEASTTVPDLNPPVTHILASSPSYTWGTFPSSNFSGLTPSSYQNGVFTINWAGADPDQNSGVPAGSIALVNIYVQIDGGTPVLISQPNGGTPNGNGVYSGTLAYNALGDGLPHTYSFYSVGVDDLQKKQYAPAAGPAAPDVTFSSVTFTQPLAIQNFAVERSIAARSYIRYLDVYFNQNVTPTSALESLANGLTGNSPNSYVQLLYYGENLTAASMPKGSVNLFTANPLPSVSLSGNDLSIDFGPNGITGQLSGAPANPAGSTFGDGWYALGIDASGGGGPTFWLTFFRLLGDTNGDGVVTGPYTTAGTDAYTVYHAEGQSGTLLDGDVDGSGAVNSKDLSDTILAKGDAVGATVPQALPKFQIFAGLAPAAQAVSVTQAEVQTLLPEAIAAWQAAGLDGTDVRKLEGVSVQVGNLGTSILGVEAANAIIINQTAAGYNWFTAASGGSGGQAFGVAGPGGETMARPGSAAANEVDLLTVLEHELGHVVGLSDNNQAGDLMDITLGLGVRRAPTAADVASVAPATGTTGQAATGGKTSVVSGQQVAPSGIASQDALAAAIESIASPGDGDRNGAIPLQLSPAWGVNPLSSGGTGSKPSSGRSVTSIAHPRGLLSSLFSHKPRRKGEATLLGPKSSETDRHNPEGL